MKKFTFLIILVLTPFKNILDKCQIRPLREKNSKYLYLGDDQIWLRDDCYSCQLTIYEQQDDPNIWPGLCQNGTKQSPINLIDCQASCCNCSIITYNGYDEIIGNAKIFNNGKAIEAEFEDVVPSVTFNSKTYELSQFHFHWGASEHALNNELYDSEIHLVHIASDDSLLVLAALIQKTATSDNLISDIFREAANSLVNYQSEIHYNINGTWRELLDEINLDIFFNYLGSLTTPNCDEGVTWIVYPELIEVDSAAIEDLKNIEDSNGNKLLFTNRDLQPLDESRSVFKCLQNT